jgi:hypothetical protein
VESWVNEHKGMILVSMGQFALIGHACHLQRNI